MSEQAYSETEKINVLIKQLFGKGNTDNSLPFYSETVNSRPQVFASSQLYSSDIPVTLPTSGWTRDSNSASLTSLDDLPDGESATNGVLRYYKKINTQVVTVGNHTSYKVVVSGENVLANSIPFNFDDNGSYGVKLYRSTGAQIDAGTGEWTVDPAGGVLLFNEYSAVQSYVSSTFPPKITFIRYIGEFGLSSTASQWTSVSNGIYFNDTNETVLIGKTTRTDATLDLEVAGDAKFDSSVTAQDVICLSDKRLKKQIKQLNSKESNQLIQKIKPCSFTWKHNNQAAIGVIAQNVQRYLPDAVHKNGDNKLAVRYNSLIALCISALQEQQKQIDSLNKQIQNMSKKRHP